MDVRCAKCGIEYEFDDAKVTAAGVTVKCTNCGHVFKVKREEPASVPPSPSTSFGQVGNFQPQSTFAKGMDGGEWMVKRVDGQVFRFKELTTLQKWIVERKVGRDDEISKTGRTWKRLGEIAELASFFQVVDAANAALHASVIPVQPAMPAPGMVQGLVVVPSTNPGMPATNPAAAAPPATPTQPADIHGAPTQQLPAQPQPPPAAAQVAAFGQAPQTPPRPPPAQPPRPPPQARDPAPPQPTPRPPPQSSGPRGVAVDELDDDDPVLQMIRRRRRNAALFVVLVILVAAGVGAALYWPQVQKIVGLTPAAAASSPQIEAAKKALRADDLAAIKAARQSIAADASPAGNAWAVLLDIATAAHEDEQARLEDELAALLPAGSPDAGPHAARAKTLRDNAAATLSGAYASLNTVRDTPGLPEGHLASAAYNLEKGGLAEQHADLEQARSAAQAGELSAEQVAAELEEIRIDQALGEVHAALGGGAQGDAKGALDKLPADADGRLTYARAALSVAIAQLDKGDAAIDAAKAAVAAVAEGDARAALLGQILGTLAQPGAAVDAGAAAAAVADAGVAVAADAGEADATPEHERAPASYEVVMAQAERARVNDHSRAAHDLFQRAAKMRPGSPRPWLGLGWAALDLGRNTEAVRAFKKVLSLDENLAEGEFGLAEALRYSGDKQQAIQAYKTYLKMAPNAKDAGTARRAIEALQ